MRHLLLSASLILGLTSAINAETSLRNLELFPTEAKRLYLSGVTSGIFWQSMAGMRPNEDPTNYCMPKDLALTNLIAEAAIEAFKKDQGTALNLDFPVAASIVLGLNIMFPCN